MAKITEEILDTVGTPILAYVAVALLAAQARELDPLDDQFEGMSEWPADTAELFAEDIRLQINSVRDVLDRIEAALPGV